MIQKVQSLLAIAYGCAVADLKAKIEGNNFDAFKTAVSDAIAGTGNVTVKASPAEVKGLKEILAKISAVNGKTDVLIAKDESSQALKDLSNAGTTFIIGNKFDNALDNVDLDDKDLDQTKKAPINGAIGDWKGIVAIKQSDVADLDETQEVAQMMRIIIRDTDAVKTANGHYGNVTYVLNVPSVGTVRVADNTSILLIRLQNQDDDLYLAVHGIDNGITLGELVAACKQLATGKKLDSPIQVGFPKTGENCFYVTANFEQRIAGRTVYVSDDTTAYRFAKELGSELAIKNPIRNTTTCQLYHTASAYAFRGLGEGGTAAGFAKSLELATERKLARLQREELVFRTNLENNAVGQKLKGVLNVLKEANIDGLNLADVVGQMIKIG